MVKERQDIALGEKWVSFKIVGINGKKRVRKGTKLSFFRWSNSRMEATDASDTGIKAQRKVSNRL